MKKNTLLYAVCIVVFFASCSSDDDQNNDPIVGKWTFSERFHNGEAIALDDCFKNDEVIFSENETLNSTFHRVAGSTCEVSHTAEGTWKNLGDSKYTMTESNEEPYSCVISENGTVFSIETTFEFQGEEIVQRDILVKN